MKLKKKIFIKKKKKISLLTPAGMCLESKATSVPHTAHLTLTRWTGRTA